MESGHGGVEHHVAFPSSLLRKGLVSRRMCMRLAYSEISPITTTELLHQVVTSAAPRRGLPYRVAQSIAAVACWSVCIRGATRLERGHTSCFLEIRAEAGGVRAAVR
jgi:hypothetical protein